MPSTRPRFPASCGHEPFTGTRFCSYEGCYNAVRTPDPLDEPPETVQERPARGHSADMVLIDEAVDHTHRRLVRIDAMLATPHKSHDDLMADLDDMSEALWSINPGDTVTWSADRIYRWARAVDEIRRSSAWTSYATLAGVAGVAFFAGVVLMMVLTR